MQSVIRWLDIGSGKNPFYFTLPGAVTVNRKKHLTGKWFFDAYLPDAHINASAMQLRLPSASVENILFHYSVGYDASCVITPAQFAKIAARAYSWLLPGGSILIRSKFHGRGRLNASLFASGLICAGFQKTDIDLVKCSDVERLPLAAIELLSYYRHHDANVATADRSSAFLLATKGNL